jgi:hypothetical protein
MAFIYRHLQKHYLRKVPAETDLFLYVIGGCYPFRNES